MLNQQQVLAILAFMGAVTALGFTVCNLHQQFLVKPVETVKA